MGKGDLFDLSAFNNSDIVDENLESMHRQAKINLIRENYDEAAKIYESILDKYYDDTESFIGLVKAYSKNLTVFTGKELDRSVRSLRRLEGANYSELDDFLTEYDKTSKSK